MTAPTIPSDIKAVAAGYGFDAPGGVMRSDVAGGFGRYAMEWDRGTQFFNVALVLDKRQFSVWNAFFLHKVKRGALPFYMKLDSGFGMSDHLVNIVPGTYQVASVNTAVASINFQVEAEPDAYRFDEDTADAIIEMNELYGEGIGSLFDRLVIFANSDTNVLDFA